MDRIFLLLGSNEGDRRKNIARALTSLKEQKILVKRKSRLYETRPWGRLDQPDFLNMAVEVACDYEPRELLRRLKSIEKSMGRMDRPRWYPRVIDLDILFYGRRCIRVKALTVPHRDVYRRPFALIPLAEISARFRPPRRKKLFAEYARESDHEGVEVYRD